MRFIVVAAALLVGCSRELASHDAAPDIDAAAYDAATLDGAIIDAPMSDAPAVDASVPDAAGDPLLALDACTEGVLASLTLARIAPLARDTDSYRPPPLTTRDEIALAITAISSSDFAGASGHATTGGYVLCRGTGDEASLVLLHPTADDTGNAWIAVRVVAARELVLEAPHPIYDSGTEAEAVEIFAITDARAIVIAGTHRCASDRESGCTGTADACGAGAPVRESDMAHAIDSVFHAVHISLAAAYPDAWFVGVHGFVGPGVSVSDGTNDPVAATSRVARLAVALHTRFGAEVTTCNDFGDASVVTAERVCGTTDVQGRFLNESTAVCTTAAATATDRFVHVEQAPEYRPERAAEMAAALLEALAPP